MADVAVDFVTQFHNLEGTLVSERKQNFFKLLKTTSLFSNEEQLNIALRDLEPKTYLESLLRIDIFIYFKKTEELLKIMKEGNEIFISKIIKQPWFFKEAFKNISAQELVNEFLPCTSFAIRTKVLKRLSATLNEAHMDAVFESVLERYGLQIALNILHSCSSTKIVEFLSENEVYLKPNQIKIIFDRDRQLFRLYLEHYRNISGHSYDNENVFKYIALKDPNLLLELNREEKLSRHSLGHRTSKKIVYLVKSDIAKDVALYTSFLKHNVIVRKLHDHFKDVYLESFPRKIEDIDINNFCNKLLRFYPKGRQWELLAQTFSKVFNDQSITDNLNYLDAYLINLCPETEVKQKWAEIKYNTENDDNFLKYFTPTKSIPLIKDKINVTSKIYDRLDLIKLMLDTCEQNKDLNCLEKVLEYFCFRHRNEDSHVRKCLLDHIQHRFQLEDLSENHWKYINEQIQILRINKEYNYYSCSVFTKKYLEFLFKNGKPFKVELLQYVQEAISEIASFLPGIKNPTIEKEIFAQIVNIIPDVINTETDEEKFARIHRQLIFDVVEFNKNNKKTKYHISLLAFPNLIMFITSILDKTLNLDYNECTIIERIVRYNYEYPQHAVNIENTKLIEIIDTNFNENYEKKEFHFYDLVKFMVAKKSRSDLDNEIMQLYFNKILNTHASPFISFWFLKNEPLTIVPYIDNIVANILNMSLSFRFGVSFHYCSCISFFKEIKLNSHLNFDVRFIEFLKKQLPSADYDIKEKIIKYLSVLLSTCDFIEVVKQFLPKKEKLDLEDGEMKKVYNLQCEVAKTLKNVIEPFRMLPTVIKFCTGDYLQSTLTSLYSICYRSQEKELYLYIDILSKKAVSARKHAVSLSCALLDYKYTLHQFKTAKQGNVSSQKHIFSTALEYFIKNPTQDLMDMVISNMNMIDKNDTETLDRLCAIEFPKKYCAVKIEKCWEYFENMRKHGLKVNKYLRSLLIAILNSTDILVKLPKEFCKNIINRYFKQQDDDLLNMELFVCNVLRYRVTEQAGNFGFVFEIISTFKVNQKRDSVKQFFEKFYVVATEDMNSNFVSLFTEYWKRLFTPVEMFDEYILLELLNIRCDSGEPFVENYARRIVSFLEQLNTEYTLHVHNKFKYLLRKALDSTFEKEKDKYIFFYNVLKFKTTTTTCILVLDVMNKVDDDNSKDIFKMFNVVLQIVKEVEVPIVQIYYKSYVS